MAGQLLQRSLNRLFYFSMLVNEFMLGDRIHSRLILIGQNASAQ